MAQYLLMSCPNGMGDSVMAVAQCSNGFHDDVVSKQMSLSEMTKTSTHERLSEARYWYSIEAYEAVDPYLLLDEDKADIFEDKNWVLLNEDPDRDKLGTSLRARGCELNIAVQGAFFYWTFTPKYGSVQIETPAIGIYEIEQAISRLNGQKSEG